MTSEPDIVVGTVHSPDPELLLNIVDRFDAIEGVITTSRLAHRWLLEKLPDEAERIHYVRLGVRPPSMPHVESDTLRVGSLEEELRKSQSLRYSGVYPQLDVLVISSEAPDILLEAMQHGVVPVVARYRGLAAEGRVIDGETGLTFDPGDAGEAKRLVARLDEDRELLARLSANAANAVAGDTDVRMHRDWLAILERMRSLPRKDVRPAPAAPPARSSNLANAFRALFRQAPAETPPADHAHYDDVLLDLERLDRL